MIFKQIKTTKTEVEVNIETPAYFTDNYSCETIYKVCESGKIIGITVFDNHVNFLEYSNVDFNKLYTSTEVEFNAAKEKLIKYLESL